MKASVIISTYNSPAWLEKVLWGYQCQTTPDFEIVMADDGSGAETKALIERFQAESPFDIRHVRHKDDGFRKWEIVNKAIEAAQGDYLIFTDGDCIPHRDLVAIHLARATPGRYLSGAYCRLPMAASRAIGREDIMTGRAFSLRWLAAHGYGPTVKWLKIAVAGTPFEGVFNRITPAKKTFNGNNSSCFRDDALRVNGFDTRIRYGGGDREFGYRLEHAGITPLLIRYSAPCLHLDHARGYKSTEVRDRNLQLIAESRAARRTRTEFGIVTHS